MKPIHTQVAEYFLDLNKDFVDNPEHWEQVYEVDLATTHRRDVNRRLKQFSKKAPDGDYLEVAVQRQGKTTAIRVYRRIVESEAAP